VGLPQHDRGGIETVRLVRQPQSVIVPGVS
jgi:hypothetical protein